MKKIKLLSLVGASMMVLAACNGTDDPKDNPSEPCDHQMSYVSDGANGHHQKCDLCGETTNVVAHTNSYVSDGENGHHQKCDLCGEVTSTVAHTLNYVSDGPNGHHATCDNCNYVGATVAHRWDEGTPGTGTILYECLDCGANKTETVEIFAAAGVYNFDSFTAGDITERTKLAEGIYLNASSSYKFTVDANAKAYTPESGSEVISVNRLKTNGASQNAGDRTIEIKMEKAGRIIAYTMTSSSSDLNRQIAVWDSAEAVTGKEDAYLVSANYTVGNAVEAKEFHVVKKGVYYVGATTNASNFYAIQVIYDTCAHELVETAGAAATCGARGTTVVTCAKCGLNVTIADKARVEHTWVEDIWEKANGKHWHKCSVCGAKKDEAACTPDETKHVDGGEPTADNPITYQEDTCSVCGGTWQHDQKEYVAPDQNELVIADASKWTDQTTKRTEHVISTNCSYFFKSETALTLENDAAGVSCFKVDNSTDNANSFVNKYFGVTGVSAGDEIVITCNSGGADRGIRFGFNAEDQVVVPKATTVDARTTVRHIVTETEATNGVKFSAYGSKVLIDTITWVKAAPKKVVVADVAKWTDTDAETSRTEHVLSENCKFIYATNNLLKKEADKAGVMCFKIDKSEADNVSSFVNKYFVITGVSAGDSLEITCNSGGSDRGLQFGFESGDQVLVPKSTAANDRSCVCHTVLPSEATNGVRFFAFGGTIHIDTITWIKA